MKRMLASLGACLLLAACAGGYEWVKPGATAAMRDADLMACGTRNAHLQKDDPAGVAAVDRCMVERGYEKQRR